jgi:hypothetical protein
MALPTMRQSIHIREADMQMVPIIQTRWITAYYNPTGHTRKLSLKARVLMQLRVTPEATCSEVGKVIDSTSDKVALAVTHLLRERKVSRTVDKPYRYSLV